MPWQHHKWEKSGRVFHDPDTGKYCYRSALGQRNAKSGSDYIPFIRDDANKVYTFCTTDQGDLKIKFGLTGIEFYHGTENLNTLRFNPRRKTGANWGPIAVTSGGMSITEVDEGSLSLGLPSKRRLKVSYNLTSPDVNTSVSAILGSKGSVRFQFDIDILKDIEFELQSEFDKVGTAKPSTLDGAGNVIPSLGLNFPSGSEWKWSVAEAQSRTTTTESGKTHVGMARGVYAKGTKLVISPDTWGTDVGITAGANDGQEDVASSLWQPTLGSMYFGYEWSTAWYDGLKWENITIAQGATIDSTLIDVYQTGAITGGTPTGYVYAWDIDTAGTMSSAGNRPSNVTKTTASIAFTPSLTTGWKTTADCKTITKEIVDRAGWVSDNAIYYLLNSTNPSGSHIVTFEAYEAAGTNEPELTITYTAAGGATILRQIMQHHGG